MFADASAMTAILVQEDDALDLLRRIDRFPARITSPLAVWETAVAVARRLRFEPAHAGVRVDEFLALMRIDIVSIPPEAGSLAVEAFARFGKGRHPAALNMGDCFAYACARIHRVPLLWKGDDFSLTDIERA